MEEISFKPVEVLKIKVLIFGAMYYLTTKNLTFILHQKLVHCFYCYL